MDSLEFLHRSGWRRTATVNTVLVGGLTITLAILVAVIASHTGSLYTNLIFHHGSCATSNRINLLLHLVINIISTGILASSNFFIQVLNSPSRAEVDSAHQKHKTLEIGVPSMTNMFHLSRFKVVATIAFCISSLPIHLLFNSAVFETDFLGGNWHLTLAAEPFVIGGKFSLPGGYLAPSGFWPDYQLNDTSIYEGQFGIGYGFGTSVNISEYRNASSPAVQNVMVAAQRAATWTRLDPYACRKEYLQCAPRSQHGDVVFIINTRGDNRTSGWTRSEVFPNSTAADIKFWDDLGLGFADADDVNSLWWSAQCTVSKDPKVTENVCWNDCSAAIGGLTPYSNWMDDVFPFNSQDANWTILNKEPYLRNFTLSPFTRNRTLELQHRTGFDFDNFTALDVAYCLAEEVSDKCKVGVSGILLLVVTLCSAVKTVQCLVVLYSLNEDPLVTLGDAIESFLVHPDPESRSMCTLSSYHFSRRFRRQDEVYENRPDRHWWEPGPHRWRREAKYLTSAIRLGAWLRAYVLFAAALGVAAFFFAVALDAEGSIQGFSHTYKHGLFDSYWFPWGRFLPSILVSNIPQLLLSTCYFVYNSIWTRLRSELEWNSYALGYKPLRVTSPKGGQVSTYRLQLPYRYSIPLILGSILLHWLVSNAIYVLLIEGGYLDDSNFTTEDRMGFTKNTYINIGYSTGPILTGLIACSVFAALPLAYASFRKLQGNMTVAGNNSLVISASCHLTTSAKKAGKRPISPLPDKESAESDNLIIAQHDSKASDHEEDLTSEQGLALSQRRLKWGVAQTERHMYEYRQGCEVKVGHLTFAGEGENTYTPEEGHWYE